MERQSSSLSWLSCSPRAASSAAYWFWLSAVYASTLARGGDDGQVLLGGPAVEGVLPGHQARKLLGQVVEGGLFLGEHRGEPVVGQGQLVDCPSRLDDAVGVLGNGTG